MDKYDDMIHLDRPESRHPKMRRADRAKIFAPFDALNGFGNAIAEQNRVFVPRILAADHIQAGLNRRLAALNRRDTVTVIYFASMCRAPDGELGEYRTITARVQHVDDLERKLILDQATIPFEDIASITNEDLEIKEDAYAYIQ